MTMVETAPAITPDTLTVPEFRDVDVVTKARDLFRDYPSKWTKGTVARDAEGMDCHIADAEKVCAIGALYLFGLPMSWLVEEDYGWARQLVNNLATFSLTMYLSPSIITVNDDFGRNQVIDVFDTFLLWREDHSPDEDPPGYDGIKLTDVVLPF